MIVIPYVRSARVRTAVKAAREGEKNGTAIVMPRCERMMKRQM